MKQVTYKINVDTKGAVKEVDELNDSIKDTGKDAKNTQDGLNTITGGAVGRFNALKTNVLGAVKSFKSLRVAIIASGIGALVLAVVALGQAFTRSEAGQNKFSKLMGMIGAVINEVLDLFADLGEAIIKAFEDPKKAIEDFATLIKENITNRLEGLAELIPALGKAISLLFELKFKEAAKVAANATGKVVLGVENIVDKTKAAIEQTEEFIKKLEEEARIQAKIEDDRAKATKIERQNVVDRANADRDIADLRFKAEQRDKFAVSERIKFLEEASALEEKITNQEIEAARLRFEAKKAENDLGKSTIEDLDEVAQLEATLIGLNTSKLRLQKRLQTSLTTFRNEEKAARDAAKKADEDAQKLKEDLRKKNEKEEAISRAKKKAADEKAQQEELKREEQQWNLLQKITNTAQEQEILELNQQYDKKFELALGNAELEKALREKQQQDLTAIDKKYSEKRAKNESDATEKSQQERLDAFEQAATMTMNALIAINELTQAFAKEDEASQKKAFKINKAISIANATINTAVGISKAIASSAPPLNFINAAIVAATGIAAVKNIEKTTFDSSSFDTSSPSTSGGAGGGANTSPTNAPSFNVVGQSGFNQVAGALGQQQPVQAFVVSGDVTTGQQLQNNTITQATF
tara:strand:+ start:308 stop:2227 length:1920 start_codon:yes stop_codon:yes gene_type:complete